VISRNLLRHRKEMIRIGYRPDRRTITDLIDSHLEALDEIESLNLQINYLEGRGL